MQHRDNYFVLYLHRYKENGLTRWCFFLVYIFFYIINPVLDNNYTIYCYLIEYLGFNTNYIFTPKMSNNFVF
jgi:hypothetical protein